MTKGCVSLWLGLLVVAATTTGAAEFGHVDDFTAVGTAGWAGGTAASNPGTGGVDGAGDGYLLLSQAFTSNFGNRNTSPHYQGDWTAAGIDRVTFYLNDLGAAQAFSIHLVISNGALDTSWQYNIGFQPSGGCWKRFTVDLTNESQWTRTRGASTFQQVLASVERVTIRHDLPAYEEFPDPLAGELGIDNITLGKAPIACPVPFADTDGDSDVDMADFGKLQACFASPCSGVRRECACFDRDDDADIDVDDLAAFTACASGPGIASICGASE